MRRTNAHRSGFTLTEMIASMAIMAAATTSGFVVIRTANDAWKRHRDDASQRRQAVAVVEHVARRVRQATRVTAISDAASTAGALTVLMPAGVANMWSRNSGTNQVLYGTISANSLLAHGITETTFVGLKANGVTTTETDLIHAVRCTVRYTLSSPAGPATETVSRTAWLRAW